MTDSMNSFATAATLDGPWTYWNVSAPWAPRASAAVMTSSRTTSAWIGSGFSFQDGYATTPVFSDVWQASSFESLSHRNRHRDCPATTLIVSFPIRHHR